MEKKKKKITLRCDWCGKKFETEKTIEELDMYYCSDECAEKNEDAGFTMHT